MSRRAPWILLAVALSVPTIAAPTTGELTAASLQLTVAPGGAFAVTVDWSTGRLSESTIPSARIASGPSEAWGCAAPADGEGYAARPVAVGACPRTVNDGSIRRTTVSCLSHPGGFGYCTAVGRDGPTLGSFVITCEGLGAVQATWPATGPNVSCDVVPSGTPPTAWTRWESRVVGAQGSAYPILLLHEP